MEEQHTNKSQPNIFTLAFAQYENQNYPEAIVLLSTAIEIANNNEEYYNFLKTLYRFRAFAYLSMNTGNNFDQQNLREIYTNALQDLQSAFALCKESEIKDKTTLQDSIDLYQRVLNIINNPTLFAQARQQNMQNPPNNNSDAQHEDNPGSSSRYGK